MQTNSLTAEKIARAIIDAPVTSVLARGVTIDTARRCAKRACLYPREWAQALGAHAWWHRDTSPGGETSHVLYLTLGTKLVVEPPLADVRHVGDGELSIRVVFSSDLFNLLRAEGAELRAATSSLAAPGDDQIRALRTEAADAGDSAQVDLCTAALDGDDAARAACGRAIEAARARRGGL